jgi:hypothetical protein
MSFRQRETRAQAAISDFAEWYPQLLGPPPKVQTERNLQNSRLNPNESSSPVDLECRIPAKCASFTQLIRESRKPEDSLERDGFEPSVPLWLISAEFGPNLPHYPPE